MLSYTDLYSITSTLGNIKESACLWKSLLKCAGVVLSLTHLVFFWPILLSSIRLVDIAYNNKYYLNPCILLQLSLYHAFCTLLYRCCIRQLFSFQNVLLRIILYVMKMYTVYICVDYSNCFYTSLVPRLSSHTYIYVWASGREPGNEDNSTMLLSKCESINSTVNMFPGRHSCMMWNMEGGWVYECVSACTVRILRQITLK